MSRRLRPIMIAGQVLVFAVVGWFVWTSLRQSWSDLTSRGLDSSSWRPWPLLGAGAVVLATYGVLIEAWRRLVMSTGDTLRYPAAASAWALSNLGRYVPGKVWAVAGLAILAQRRGVSPLAATGSAIMLQLLSIGTGSALALALAPGAISPGWATGGVAVALASVIVLAWRPAFDRLVRIIPAANGDTLPRLSLRTVAVGSFATAAAWVTYGLGLSLLAAGIAPGTGLSLSESTGIFAAAYVAGLVAVFAPGGLAVREGVLFGLLATRIDAGTALTIAVGSRVLLTLTELIAAVIGWYLSPRAKDQTEVT